VELVEGKTHSRTSRSLLSLLDEACALNRGADDLNLLQQYVKEFKDSSKHFMPAAKAAARDSFTIRHFAGTVTYCVVRL
jgi:myosin heavy subunit